MIEEKKKQRFQFLQNLYQVTNGSESYLVDMWEIGNKLGFDHETTSNIVDYLKGEGLLEPKALGGGISITHSGIKEIEEAHENPDKPTEHFMPINIINIENMANSSVQQGNSDSTQNNNFSTDKLYDLESLTTYLETLIGELKEDKNLREELIAENNTLKAQIKSPKPKNSVINESLKSVKELVKNITTKTGSTQMTDLIESLLNT